MSNRRSSPSHPNDASTTLTPDLETLGRLDHAHRPPPHARRHGRRARCRRWTGGVCPTRPRAKHTSATTCSATQARGRSPRLPTYPTRSTERCNSQWLALLRFEMYYSNFFSMGPPRYLATLSCHLRRHLILHTTPHCATPRHATPHHITSHHITITLPSHHITITLPSHHITSPSHHHHITSPSHHITITITSIDRCHQTVHLCANAEATRC